ncbi:Metacaspase-1 [Rhizoctonia solani AG-1 IB]|uniref:Metacaspase-1 n=1 Tax=Thanatephorus cucumeris (strain AG1-IB / isolate 7/3/14) TaxID=1108050 RepID=M5CFA1_THACB|nr:Metacaspase-1 [Rhizoctonia solani AG-1 IB]
MNTRRSTASKSDVTFSPRGVLRQSVEEDQSKRSMVEQYIQKAIEDGDNMGIPARPVPQGAVQRRALIIAPEYEDYLDDQLPTLPATANDVKLVHDMLIKFGYERKDIRILCDVCAGNGYSYPTRKNILDNLQWLISDTTPNAYRYLHFSGHGVRILSDSEKGKCVIDSDWDPCKGPTTEDPERSSSNVMLGSRIARITVPKDQLQHYNEDLPVKAAGYGFRGKSNYSTVTTKAPGPPGDILAGEDNALNNSIKEDKPPVPAEGTSVLEKVIEALGGLVFQPINVDSLTVTLHENLPQREKAMNSIKARVLSWTASHQRQEAWDDNNGHAGLFTQSFTQACHELKVSGSGTFTYRELYDKASEMVSKQRKEARHPRPQFVQLWSSLEDDEESTKVK